MAFTTVRMLELPATHYFAALGLLALVIWLIRRLGVKPVGYQHYTPSWFRYDGMDSDVQADDGSTEKRGDLEGLPAPKIEPLTEFDWKKTKPQEIRPFKPIYYITMG